MEKSYIVWLAALFVCADGAFAQQVGLRNSRMAAEMNLRQAGIGQTRNVSRKLLPNFPFVMPNVSASGKVRMALADASVMLEEDFSKFAAGSEDAPDATRLEDEAMGMIPDAYTSVGGWAGLNIYQAGGKAYIAAEGLETGYIDTPPVDLSANNGAYIARFKARVAEKGASDNVVVLNSDLYADAYTEAYYGTLRLTDQWQEFEVPLCGGTTQAYMQLYAENRSILLDDVSLTMEGIVAPIVAAPMNYTGTEFDASWQTVENATSYLVSVYCLSDDEQFDYLLDHVETTGTSYHVSGLDASTQYYFDVKAKNEQYVSCASFRQEVKLTTLAAPVLKPCTDVTKTGFTGNWEPVTSANYYASYTYISHTAEAAEDYALLDTDFEGIVSDGTIDRPEQASSTYLNNYIDRCDWIVNNPAFVSGILGLDNSSASSSYSSQLFSPYYDLSAGDQQVTVKARMMGKDLSAVQINMCSDEGGTMQVLWAKYVNLTSEFADYEIVVKKGQKEKCYLYFEPKGEGIVYIDNLKVSKHLAKGERIDVPFIAKEGEATSQHFTVPERGAGDLYAFTAEAYYNTGNPFELIKGEKAELMLLDDETGVEETSHAENVVEVRGGILHVACVRAATVSVYDALGRAIVAPEVVEGAKTIALPAYGIYVVKVGEEIRKVAY